MKKQHAARFGIYLVGMVLLALGITLNTKAGLGGIGLGTVLSMLGVGRVIYFFNRAAKAKLLPWAGL